MRIPVAGYRDWGSVPTRKYFAKVCVMTSCRHMNLVLLPNEKNRLRCRHCHLTISADELQGSYCPECYEASGRKLYDFEEIEAGEQEKTRYRCEQCGVVIETE